MADAAPDNVFIDDIIVPAVDGFPLAGTLFLARGRKTHAVLINSATAVPRGVYRSFAAYLASRGCAVLTYDYRGTGESLPPVTAGKKPTLKGFKASMADWAALDTTAAVAWMRGRYKELPLSYVGHSFGGHALGLIPNSGEVSRALLIASHLAYWKAMPTPERYRVFAMMELLGVPLTKLLGYMPGGLGLGTSMPKDAYLQWARWVASENYLLDDKTLTALGNFANYTGPLRSLTFTDDAWVTQTAVELLAKEFTATRPQVIALSPADLGVAKIGHMGFFRSELRDTLWRGSAEWLEAETPAQRSSYPAAARAS